MESQKRGVSKTWLTDVHARKNVTPAIPAGLYGPPGPTGAGRSA